MVDNFIYEMCSEINCLYRVLSAFNADEDKNKKNKKLNKRTYMFRITMLLKLIISIK